MKALVLSVLACVILAIPASAAGETVESLLKDGFSIAAVMPSTAGPGIFLQKGDRLFACFVAETPTSPDLATRYCKPVH